MASHVSVLGSHVSVLGSHVSVLGSHISVLGCHPAPVKVNEEQMAPRIFCRQIQVICGSSGAGDDGRRAKGVAPPTGELALCNPWEPETSKRRQECYRDQSLTFPSGPGRVS